MSLDVYLKADNGNTTDTGVFIREEGQIKEITRAEWDEKFPMREPVMTTRRVDGEVYHANITHNLNQMAREAGVYKCVWRPEEMGITRAHQLVERLRDGIALLKSDPERFKKFDASNEWGTYEQFVPWLEQYLDACERHPQAKVSVWR